MTNDEKLAAILAAVQIDPGGRGLARDPHDNLFTATKGDFEAACRSFVNHPAPALDITTGFYIPTAVPPAFETDGPLGCVFLFRALSDLNAPVGICVRKTLGEVILSGLRSIKPQWVEMIDRDDGPPGTSYVVPTGSPRPHSPSHVLAVEHVGRATDGRYYSMRGRDITDVTNPVDEYFLRPRANGRAETIGIGDGGNEIGMGKVPHETVVKNIPNGDQIHCRVPTDHLIVAGVSNWGAYALSAALYVLRGEKPPVDLFDPNRERQILEVMVNEGPLVDGVTGKQTATVDGLTWDEYTKPLVRIREILES